MQYDRSVRKAVLLAAGRGTRLGALTANRPKPMVPVRGVPLVEHILVGLRAAGIREYLMVVAYLADVIRDYFGDGSRWGVAIDYVLQETAHGTGGALRFGEAFAAGDPIVASFGDILVSYANYPALISTYETTDCAAVIGINPMDDPSAGASVYHEDGRLLRIVEKPPAGNAVSPWNHAGVSVYGPDVWPALARLKPSPRGELELTDAITTLVAEGRDVRVCKIGGFWSDVGTPASLAEAEHRWGEQA
jgi:dTDP-glucose pyrophosphorylase